MKSPAFQFYPDDFMGGKPGMMTPEQTHVYVWLLCLEWNQNGFAFDVATLARWCRVTPAVFRRAWPVVSECFTCAEGRWTNDRLERERTKQEEFRAKMAANGKKGGRPRIIGEPDAKPEGKPKRKPQVSRRLADHNLSESLPSPTPLPDTTTTPTGGTACAVEGQDGEAPEPGTEPERVPPNWVALLGDDWTAATDGTAPYGEIGRQLKALLLRHGIAITRPAWQTFCASADRRFGAAYFAKHFGDYKSTLVGVGGDEYGALAAIGVRL